MSKKVTSIRIEEKILKDFKKLAIDRDRTVSGLIEELIKKELEKS